MKKFFSFPVDNLSTFRNKMLNWSSRFNIFCLLDNRQYNVQQLSFECLLATGAKEILTAEAGNAFASFSSFYSTYRDEWIFGHFAYDLKNETESLVSSNPDYIGFEDMYLFIPEIVLQLLKNEILIYADDSDTASNVYASIQLQSDVINLFTIPDLKIRHRFSESEYIGAVHQIQKHIQRGDCYELNLCQEFYAEGANVDPLTIYDRLISISPNPFSAFYRIDDKYCICASPERYLKKIGNNVISQPIKGTAPRSSDSALADEENKNYLRKSEKEKSENVMIVDLVRNDLSKVCVKGSVKVDELFGIYSFPQVHQMISTISGMLLPDVDIADIIKATFPMGSMTGAPKRRVMQIIEDTERTHRGLFSGAIGYFSPDGDFDLNVVIRSVLYNKANKYLSYQAGSAITYYSHARQEYEECLLKAKAIADILK